MHELTETTAKESLELRRGDLCATVLTPWSPLYRRTRFNHCGFVKEVRLGDTTFSTSEGKTENCGMGMCCEYKCPEQDQTVPEGATWLKPGIGVLTRGAEPWNFKDETDYAGLPVILTASEDTACFDCHSPIVSGWGYDEKRTLRVTEDSLKLSVQWTNTGNHTWDFVEYCHNFTAFNGRPIDQHHRLIAPCVAGLERVEPVGPTHGTWNGLAWDATPDNWFLYKLTETREAAFAWLLCLDDDTASIGGTLSEKPSMFAVFGDHHCVCPEAYAHIVTKPGETRSWTREWHFTR